MGDPGGEAGPLTPVLVSIDEAHLPDLGSVVERLAAAGMRVEQVHELSGIVTGAAAVSQLRALGEIEGVAQAEVAAGSFQIAPPDADIQ